MLAISSVFLSLQALPLRAVDGFVAPSKEELAMTSLPGYPGAPAVVLFREEITKDDLHVQSYYNRIKILTEDGKKYANVELVFGSSQDHGEYVGDDNMIADITGRTIHADGSIVPFTGKPYLKMVEKGQDFKVQEKVFTLPDVQVGSIIEYRYTMRYNDNVFEAPDWFIQGDLYLKAAHYVWYPTGHEMVSGATGNPINAISWFPILPEGAKIDHHNLPMSAPSGAPLQIYELNVKNVAPQAQEEYMPPIASYTYRVLFSMTEFQSGAEFWKSRGKSWSKSVDNFIGSSGDLNAATQSVIAGATTQEEKLRKIYAAVEALENTDFTRKRNAQEEKALGHTVKSASDVWANKRGTGMEIAELFVGMARAAGMKAYMMRVPDRSERLFVPAWLNMNQLDGVLAIVNVNGKEQFFDPGSRYCPYGQIEWENTAVNGLRQTDNGTDFATTPGQPYTMNRSARAGNLTMAEDGSVKGTIDLTYQGAPALYWRQRALRGDEESVRSGMRTAMERLVPSSLEIRVAKIDNMADYEKPLHVLFDVKGTIGTSTGKRLLLPADFLLSHEKPAFPHEKREQAVYFHYPQMIQDAVRINLPKSMEIEASPTPAKFKFADAGLYNMTVATTPDSVTVRRDFVLNAIIVPVKDYPVLRTFYTQFEQQDQESVVLKASAGAGQTPPAAGN